MHKENTKLLAEKDQLLRMIARQQNEVDQLRSEVLQKDQEILALRDSVQRTPHRQGVAPSAFYALLLVTALLAAFAAYSLLSGRRGLASGSLDVSSQLNTPQEREEPLPGGGQGIGGGQENMQTTTTTTAGTGEDTAQLRQEEKGAAPTDPMTFDTATQQKLPAQPTATTPNRNLGVYKVKEKAFFHDEPNAATRRNAFIVQWNNALLTALDEKDGFIYVVFTNDAGQTSKGWLLKDDLIMVQE